MNGDCRNVVVAVDCAGVDAWLLQPQYKESQ